MTRADWIAVDWGTSNLRAWAMAQDGAVLAEARSPRGMGTLEAGCAHFEPALLEIAGAWLTNGRVTQVVICGMAGSRQGWAEAPYLKVPARPHADGGLIRATSHDPRIAVHIASGVSQTNPPDVMRGEETQIAGLLAQAAGFAGVVAMPGTHSKWVQIVDDEIFHFVSFMTGELYALLCDHSILRHSVGSGGFDAAAFDDAVADTLSHPERVAAKLFELRAAHLLVGEDPVAASSQLSGYLVGLELAGAKPYWLGQQVALVAAGHHAERWTRALGQVGITPAIHDPDICVLAGLRAAHSHVIAEGVGS